MNTVTQDKSKVKSVIEVLETCRKLEIPARMVGRWCWIKFAEKPSMEIRQALNRDGIQVDSQKKSMG